MELPDMQHLKCCGRKPVRVGVPPPAQAQIKTPQYCGVFTSQAPLPEVA